MVKFTCSTSATQGFTVWILGVDMAPLASRAEVMSHITQPEALTTRIYNYVLRGFGEEKKKEREKRLATDISSGANL